MSTPFGFVGGTVAKQNLPSLQKGGAWSKTFTFSELDANNAPVNFDWTSCILTLYIFVGGRSNALQTLTGSFNGSPPATTISVTFSLTSAQTQRLPPNAQWELWLEDASGNLDCMIQGNANTLQLA